MLTVRNAPELRSQHDATPPVQLQYPSECHAAAAMKLPESPYGQTSKCISSVSFVQIESKFFYNTQEIQTQKNDGPEFWNSNSVIFENFLKFSKMRHAVPLWPIWTIMVEAKLDQSRVLVTKFHQNRLTLKGRSAVRVTQRHRQTDSQTNSAENNGSSSLQSGQYTYPLTYSPAAHMGHWATQVTGNPGKPEK